MMGFEYALVHLKYNIPPAIVLTLLYRPFFTKIDIYKILFLIIIAVVSTIPWDSYLIRRKIWTYPPSVIVGPKLCSIPAEEVFFFIIQTYNTSLIYLILSKPVLHSRYLVAKKDSEHHDALKSLRNVGQTLLGICVIIGGVLIWKGGKGLYLGLILAWAGPFLLLLWTLAYQFLAVLPRSNTLVPIALPTIYLWVVDTIALRRGTWTIESGTKFGVHLWDGLEIEEAVFFLASNTLIIFGLIAFDNALAILLTFPDIFPEIPQFPSPVMLVRALLTRTSEYDMERITGIQEAVVRLQKKSRSFYLASSVFPGRLRIDLILLYSFCRVADDLVDNASTKSEAYEWVTKLSRYLSMAYASKETRLISNLPDVRTLITENFPLACHSALSLLPTHILSFGPLFNLLEGFKTDLEFPSPSKDSTKLKSYPIKDENDLEVYARRVAGTVAEMCLELVFHHSYPDTLIDHTHREEILRSGGRMGIALQYVNIVRDIETDARMGGRVYLPTIWLKELNLTHAQLIENVDGVRIDELRARLLDKAFNEYEVAKVAIEQLPLDVGAPMRVAVDSYMEIGKVLREKGYKVKEGRATVPKLRRLRVAWDAMRA